MGAIGRRALQALRPVGRLADRRVLLGLIVLVALGCRLAGAGDRLSADEGYSWLVASAHGWQGFLDALARYENTPPLYYLLLRPLSLDDEVWIRLPALVAGVAAVPVLYAIVRPLAGTRAALLGALTLAVAPYAVSFSDYSRAFTLATLAMLVALWGAVRLAAGGSRRWWLAYAAGAVTAIYSQYYAVLFLLPLVGALAFELRARWREVVLVGLAPLLAIVPWIHQIQRSRDLAGVTKVDPTYPGPSPGAVRDLAARLTFGEHGTAGSAALRWLQLLAVAVALGAAVAVLWRGSRPLLVLIGGTAAGTLVLHALTAIVGPDVFAPRYLTVLIPLAAGLIGAAVGSLPWRAAVPAAVAALLALGVAVVVQRSGRELEPDYARVRALAREARPRVVLTNSAVVSYYLRDMHPLLDRPFDLGPGAETLAQRPYAVVDDDRVGPGARSGPGRRVAVEGILVRLVR
jgi:4-amino-4-deoxy-L-arabinose transferase-like glycosyltransferase